ncbi:MAG: hypothetical protein ACR2J9_01470 [Gaiellales bacterium]
MSADLPDREHVVREALRTELGRLDTEVVTAIGRALERDEDRLTGGSWGIDDSEGCLLTLAARELGLQHGEELLHTSVAAVRIPALFDEVWALILQRTGDPRAARAITHRLVAEALLRQDQATGSGAEAAASADIARIALAR